MPSGRPDIDARVRIKDLPASAPYFVIFAHDQLGGAVVRGYAAAAHAAGVEPAVVESVLQQADLIDAWPRKKLPDGDHLQVDEAKQLAWQLQRRGWKAADDQLEDPRVALAEARAHSTMIAAARLAGDRLQRAVNALRLRVSGAKHKAIGTLSIAFDRAALDADLHELDQSILELRAKVTHRPRGLTRLSELPAPPARFLDHTDAGLERAAQALERLPQGAAVDAITALSLVRALQASRTAAAGGRVTIVPPSAPSGPALQ